MMAAVSSAMVLFPGRYHRPRSRSK